ncbi:endonuclease/exonuclease/phosphatase family protein [Blastococcus brunescens]|uniref:Endonuclease/exonuclease/phosphatase family protein n=1 Tax=Blastococcus brunescens TaxID=1564165 RepID=A0ABZ1B8W3_9ACTN|nr:endonuclease/exonuclease/phosphatase family protein [Blastococcus sp. BMG 8361]WRL66258.1 endonuclease/exonuclease/phosphatase family protein [Blastococcus sp. BMG 8361]
MGESVGLVDEENFDNAREPIAQTFEADGDTFTVIANHLKSKGAGGASGDNADQGDGQGAYNADRTRQAQALAGFVETLQASTGDDDVLVLGDLNAYSQEDPIELLREAGLTDLGTQFDEGRYSYVFDDMSGSLDHAMATASLTAKVTDVAHWNINSVESFAYQYDGDPELYAPHQFRSSDHDPILVGIDLTESAEPEPEVGNPTGIANGNSWIHPQDQVAYIAGYFVNTDSVPVQVRLLTDHGQSEAQTVAPGAAGYLTVDTGLAELPAGTATLRVYKNVGGQGYQSLFPVTYPGRSATGTPPPGTGNPTGVANGNSWVHPQEQVAYIAGHFVNTDSVPVDVRLLTPHGQSQAQRVAPGQAVYLTVDTQLTELSAGTATFRVYKNVGGKGYQSLFRVAYPGQSAAGD